MRPSKQRRLRFLRDMLLIRRAEEAMTERYAEEKMRCPIHLSIGQEATSVGVCGALRRSDYVVGTHRSHAPYLAKGGDLQGMVSELYGRATGCAAGKGGSMHLVDRAAGVLGTTPIVGGSIPVAVGAAFGSWLQGEKRVTAVFFGEGATEEGVFAESINFASLKKLPVVFVCENNLYSVYSHLRVRQPASRSRVAMAEANGVPGAFADGNDVEAVYWAARKAVDRARRGGGPTFLELPTYRWREHCGPSYDNDLGYRTPAEFRKWKARCPLARYEDRLLRDRVLTAKGLERLRARVRGDVDKAYDRADRDPFPNIRELTTDIYAEASR